MKNVYKNQPTNIAIQKIERDLIETCKLMTGKYDDAVSNIMPK